MIFEHAGIRVAEREDPDCVKDSHFVTVQYCNGKVLWCPAVFV